MAWAAKSDIHYWGLEVVKKNEDVSEVGMKDVEKQADEKSPDPTVQEEKPSNPNVHDEQKVIPPQ